MRMDVKLGLIGSLVVVVLAGLYLTGQDESKPDIPVQQKVEKKPETPTGIAQRSQRQHPARPQRRSPAGPPRTRTATPARQDDAASGAGQAFTAILDSQREKEDVIEFLGGPAAGTQFDTKERAPDSRMTVTRPGEDTGRGVLNPPPSIPTRSVTASARPQPERSAVTRRVETHTVKAGETIHQLSRWYYGDASHARLILQANPQITDPRSIPAGARIVIPESPGPEAGAPRRAESSRDAAVAGAGGRAYSVREGDSLYGIARDQLGAGARWKEIYELNKLIIGSDPALLKVGTALRLPSP